jgi:phage shock protein C
MNLGDELQKLSALHASGSLTEEEFKRAKERLLSSAPTASSDPVVTAVNAFRRSRADRWLGGVCGCA